MNIANSLNFERYDELRHSRYHCIYHYCIHTATMADVRIHVTHNSNVAVFMVYLFLNNIYWIMSKDIVVERVLTLSFIYFIQICNSSIIK